MTNISPAIDEDIHSRAQAAGYEPERLEAVVLLVGLGAAGQNTAQSLALSGIRELRVVDGDHFERHNQTRSPGYPFGRAATHPLPKAPAVAEWLKRCATHPHAEVRWANAWVEELGAGLFDGVDVVVSCVDSLRARA